MFLSIIRKHEDCRIDFDSPRFNSYKRKLESVSDKIEKWHESINELR